MLMLDCEPSGIDGAKEALWYFAEQQFDVRLAWSPSMHSGAFAGRQPESLTRDDVGRVGRIIEENCFYFAHTPLHFCKRAQHQSRVERGSNPPPPG